MLVSVQYLATFKPNHLNAIFDHKGKGNCIAVMEHHVTATECHLPHGITQTICAI